MLTPLPFALAAILIVALARKSMDQAATAFILLINWSLATVVVESTTELYPVWCLAPLDYLTAIVFFIVRRSHWQSVVMGIYAAQLVCHAAYVYAGGTASATYYSYWLLTYLAWLQAALVGGWIIHDVVAAWLSGFSRRRDASSHHLHSLIAERQDL